MKIHILSLLCILSYSFINGLDLNSRIMLDKVQINEELDSNYLIQNLTDTIVSRVKSLKPANQQLRLDSVKLQYDSDDFHAYDYFSIDLKKFRLFLLKNENYIIPNRQHQSATGNANQTTIVLLKTGPKKLDRERLCRMKSTTQLKCFCETECLVYLDILASFYSTDQNEQIQMFSFILPIEILDANDNKPFFYQNELFIDLDQFEEEIAENQPDSSVVKIPLKLALDLDSTERNRILNYELEKHSKKIKLVFNQKNELSGKEAADPTKLYLSVNLTENFLEQFRLVAYDFDYSTFQNITLKYSKYKSLTTQTTNAAIATSAHVNSINNDPSPTVLFNLVSATNEVDIRNNYEISFRGGGVASNLQKHPDTTTSSESEVLTIAYLLLSAKNKPDVKKSILGLDFKQYLENSNELSEGLNLFQVSEMRNGLYSLQMRKSYFSFIVASFADATTTLVNYKLVVFLNVDNEYIERTLNVKIPRKMVKLLKMNSRIKSPAPISSRPPAMTSLSSKIDATQLSSSNSSLFNSVIIVTTICIIVILLGLVCFIVSLIVLIINRCKKRGGSDNSDEKKISPNDMNKLSQHTKILVYDMLPTDPNNADKLSNQGCGIGGGSLLYSSSSSNTSTTSNNNKSNNISPVTTTTTSMLTADHQPPPQQQQIQMVNEIKCNNHSSSSPGPLFDTSLLVNDWFLKNTKTTTHNHMLHTTTTIDANLIKKFDIDMKLKKRLFPIMNNADHFSDGKNEEVASNQSGQSGQDILDSSVMVNKYKNELYKSSHLILKQQREHKQMQSSSSNYAHLSSNNNGDVKMYQAKPVKLHEGYVRAKSSSYSSGSSSTGSTSDNNYNEASMSKLEVASSSSNTNKFSMLANSNFQMQLDGSGSQAGSISKNANNYTENSRELLGNSKSMNLNSSVNNSDCDSNGSGSHDGNNNNKAVVDSNCYNLSFINSGQISCV